MDVDREHDGPTRGPVGRCCRPARCSSPAATTRRAGVFQAGSGPALSSAELYDPATGLWTATGDMHRPHALSTATVLADGDVLVAGGRVGGHGASSGTSSYDTGGGSVIAELYDPTTGAWTETAPLGQRRELEIAVALPDGRVVVAGGLTAGRALASTEVYDPTAGRIGREATTMARIALHVLGVLRRRRRPRRVRHRGRLTVGIGARGQPHGDLGLAGRSVVAAHAAAVGATCRAPGHVGQRDPVDPRSDPACRRVVHGVQPTPAPVSRQRGLDRPDPDLRRDRGRRDRRAAPPRGRLGRLRRRNGWHLYLRRCRPAGGRSTSASWRIRVPRGSPRCRARGRASTARTTTTASATWTPGRTPP